MKTTSLVSVALGIILAVSCSKVQPAADNQVTPSAAETTPVFVDGVLQGEVVVEFDDATADALSQTSAMDFVQTKGLGSEAINDLGIVSMERLFPDAGEREALHRKVGLHRFYKVRYDSSIPVTKASTSLGQLDGVVSIESPRQVQLHGIPFNDPYASAQWDLYNDGSFKKAVAGVDVNVLAVWNEITTGDPKVIVGVVDEGINLASREFNEVTLPGGESGSRNFIQKNYTIVPGNHGCNVAGIIGAVNNNKFACSSIAGGSDGHGGVRLISCEVFEGSSGASDDGMANAIIWAADKGAVIVNNSWGYVVDTNNDGKISDSEYDRIKNLAITPSLIAAFKYFNLYAGCDKDGNQIGPMKGGIVVFSAGNDDIDVGKPAIDENVIAVGALAPDGSRTYYSNYGDWVDLCAPGGSKGYGSGNDGYIWQIDATDTKIVGMAGTSQAAPHVSGVAALAVSALGGKGFTGEMLKEMLIQGASHKFDELHGDKQVGPMVDAYSAIIASVEDPDPITNWSEKVVSNRVQATMTIPANTSKCVLAVSKSREDLEQLSSLSFPSTINATVVHDVTKGDKVTAEVRHLLYKNQYYVAVYSVNVGRLKISDIREINTPEDQAPVVVASLANTLVKDKTDTLVYKVSEAFADPDGDDLTYTFKRSGAKNTEATLSGDELRITCGSGYGTSVYTITAKDEGNKTVDTSFKVLIRDPKKDYAADVYPNPCSEVLYVAPGIDKSTSVHVVITNVSGAVVFDKTVNADAFNPVTVDASKFAVGVYTVKISFGDKVYEQSVMKI